MKVISFHSNVSSALDAPDPFLAPNVKGLCKGNTDFRTLIVFRSFRAIKLVGWLFNSHSNWKDLHTSYLCTHLVYRLKQCFNAPHHIGNSIFRCCTLFFSFYDVLNCNSWDKMPTLCNCHHFPSSLYSYGWDGPKYRCGFLTKSPTI